MSTGAPDTPPPFPSLSYNNIAVRQFCGRSHIWQKATFSPRLAEEELRSLTFVPLSLQDHAHHTFIRHRVAPHGFAAEVLLNIKNYFSKGIEEGYVAENIKEIITSYHRPSAWQ
jgi:hypothetical protein